MPISKSFLAHCRRTILPVLLGLALGYPQPSQYPISWELDFTPGLPTRVVVVPEAGAQPQAYWYLTYNVVNRTGQEQTFLPVVELLTEDGRIIRSDKAIPKAVFDSIRQREGAKFLEQQHEIGGEIRLGDDEARDGVAIWREPAREMGRFSIFIQGLSGETTTVTGPDDKPVILRKTLQLNYLVRGDDVFPGDDEVNENARLHVMR